MRTDPRTTKRWLLIAIAAGLPCGSYADVLTDWNVTVTTLTPAAGKNPIEESRIYAMLHAATHDALNAIKRRYQPYAFAGRTAWASPEAAVAAAAHAVLRAEIPSQQAALDSAYASSLSGIPGGSAKAKGIWVGRCAAAAILRLRSNDGSSAVVPYTPGSSPGDWMPTPPAFVPAVLPGWGNVVPFTLKTGEQFRPAPPEYFDLTSEEYANDYNEVKSIGAMSGPTRSNEQSEIARFWYEGSPVGWNRIARNVATREGLGLWDNARLFALLNLAMADGYIAGENVKFFYSFWRPVTAVRNGDTDGNPDTIPDPSWLPYLVTPPTPDFASTHSVLGAAAAEVLARFFGTDYVTFTTTSGAPFAGITRSFTSFSQAARENADSRVYAGIHFRSSCTEGVSLGTKIGRHTFVHYLRPVKRHGGGSDR
jgi:hypothetical protein